MRKAGEISVTEAYRTIQGEGSGEFVISRSRFIGWSKPVFDEEEALAFIEGIRKGHRDASHNVWAYKLGEATERYSDDGEPRGTGGIPVLEVIRKESLRDVIVVVTRYFGGVKLGAGGLLRAYTQGAVAALEAGKVIERRPYITYYVTTDYALAEKLAREYSRRGYICKDTAYQDNVRLTLLIPGLEEEALRALTAEFTAGKGSVEAGPAAYLDFPV